MKYVIEVPEVRDRMNREKKVEYEIMRYFYQIAYTDYEDFVPTVLVSEKKYSAEEFEKLAKGYIKEAVEKCLNKEEYIGIDSIENKVASLLIEKEGFSRLEFDAVIDFWGASILDKECEEEFEFLGLPTDLKDKVIKHNEMINGY